MHLTRLISTTGLLAISLYALTPQVYAACTLRLTAPGDGATVRAANVTVYGQGGADANQGDSGTVTATINGTPFFNYSGSFTAAVSFLQSRGVAVTLRPGLNFLSVSGSAGSCRAFDKMTVLYEPELELSKNKGAPDDGLSCNSPAKQQGNPINASIGNKYQAEEDYRREGTFPLLFTRHYNSFDGYWRHNYSTRLKIASNSLTLVQADGRESKFSLSAGVATAEATELGQLAQNGSGWRYSSPTQELFDFDAQGQLTRWGNRNGQFHQLSYSNSSVTVEDAVGNSFSFTQDDHYQPLSVIVSGLTIGYQYDTQARLTKVTKTRSGSNEVRKFYYEDSRYPQFLTGITDERGIRYATWTYDDQGRAISSEHAGGADKILISYNADGSSTVTNELGKTAIYRFQIIQGIKRITAIEGNPTANCPNSNSTFTYDTRGLLKTKTDNKGHITAFDYNTRGQEIRRTEASGTAQARTMTTDWHPTLFLPAKVTEPKRIIQYQYDDQGRQLSQTIISR
ncbi:hypothetical protein MRBBS_1915 [Marinobacter sp. BSs20148]|jgi:YD repeat-containing protein|nr:hypothetical protein MRBBS_1915 [Marinobacter sp. BSs20148]